MKVIVKEVMVTTWKLIRATIWKINKKVKKLIIYFRRNFEAFL